MKLILFRHGLAMDRDVAIAQKMQDSQRPLTEKGRLRTQKMSRHIEKWGASIDLLVVSPLLRARQTAEILKEELKIKNCHECPELVPWAPPQAFGRWLETHAKSSTCILAVGHEPQMSVFASWALSGQTSSFIALKKSGVLCLEVASLEQFQPGSAELTYLIPPKFLLK